MAFARLFVRRSYAYSPWKSLLGFILFQSLEPYTKSYSDTSWLWSRRRKRWKTNGEKMVDFWCRFFHGLVPIFHGLRRFFTVYKGHKRCNKKNISLLIWSFSRLVFHGLPPLDFGPSGPGTEKGVFSPVESLESWDLNSLESLEPLKSTLDRDRKNNINFFSINFLESQSGCSHKFMLGKVYVRNSPCFTVEKRLA